LNKPHSVLPVAYLAKRLAEREQLSSPGAGGNTDCHYRLSGHRL